jgi:peptide deformylase
LRRIFIVSTDEGYFECINPQIVSCSGSQIGEEGCLSVRGKFGTVKRPMKVTVKAQDRFGKPFTVKASGFLARAFCHENDHLDGVLYIDRKCVPPEGMAEDDE